MNRRIRKIVEAAKARRAHHRRLSPQDAAIARLAQSVVATGAAAELSDGALWERVGTWADNIGLSPEQEAELNELLARFEEKTKL